MTTKRIKVSSHNRELIDRVRAERNRREAPQAAADASIGRLRKRFAARRAKEHRRIQQAALDLLGLDYEAIQKQHRLAGEAMRKLARREEKRLLKAAQLKARESHRLLAYISRFSDRYNFTKPNPGVYACVLEATSHDGSETVGASVEDADFEHDVERVLDGAGRNLIRKKLTVSNVERGGTVETTDFFEFLWQPPAAGVGDVMALVDPNGVAKLTTTDRCWPNVSAADCRIRAWIDVAQETNEGIVLFPKQFLTLVPQMSAEDGDADVKWLSQSQTLPFHPDFPVSAGNPLVITVGVECMVAASGLGCEAVLDFNSNGWLSINIPSVSLGLAT